ncbi:hypothetical protein GCM10010964_05960 [Caldovatus sediminis]|uniref:Uncharacterized protein n=1 Tax=Caldovatus sediminis TaxID=2041189 RepID=A0A8J2Z803_9PROT|nr:hypothetical protein [Caldovatus sediminis]GGG20558.1 hypothetical protein GCM10010964_05960 [Caldovatus sediminis]
MSSEEFVLLEAVRIVREVGVEANALFEALEKELGGKPGDRRVAFGESERDGTYDSGDYVCDSTWITFPAYENRAGRGSRRRVGKLSILLDFGRPESLAESLGYPCAVVAWGLPGKGMGWDFHTNGNWKWPPSRDEIALIAERVFVWIGDPEEEKEWLKEPPVEAEWFYVVPLLDLKHLDAAKRLLLDPVWALLSMDTGADISDAFMEAPEVTRFTWNPTEGPPQPIR